MKKTWHDRAWAEYEYWQEENRRMVKVDGDHRLVYRITEEGLLEIASCRGHYE